MSAKNFVSIKLHSKLEFKRRTTADSKIFIKANSSIMYYTAGVGSGNVKPQHTMN